MALVAPPSWYHGGVPGLAEGDFILPAWKTGILTTGEAKKRYGFPDWLMGEGSPADHPALVNITGHLADATYYAAMWSLNPWLEGDGMVYKVAPQDGPVPVKGLCHQTCSLARVVEVVTPSGVTSMRGCTLPLPHGPVVAGQATLWQLWSLRGGQLPASRRVIVRQ